VSARANSPSRTIVARPVAILNIEWSFMLRVRIRRVGAHDGAHADTMHIIYFSVHLPNLNVANCYRYLTAGHLKPPTILKGGQETVPRYEQADISKPLSSLDNAWAPGVAPVLMRNVYCKLVDPALRKSSGYENDSAWEFSRR